MKRDPLDRQWHISPENLGEITREEFELVLAGLIDEGWDVVEGDSSVNLCYSATFDNLMLIEEFEREVEVQLMMLE